jgi:hypothetical protein
LISTPSARLADRRPRSALSTWRGLRIDAVAPGQRPQALLTMLYRSTDRLCRCGAPMKNLSHRAHPSNQSTRMHQQTAGPNICGFRRSRPRIPIGSRPPFRFEAGRGSDLMSATWRLLPRIDAMMFCPEALVKRAWVCGLDWISASARVGVANGGRSTHCAVAEPAVSHGLVAPKVGRAGPRAHVRFRTRSAACASSRRRDRCDRRCE